MATEVKTGFRTHLMLAHEVVGAVGAEHATFSGMEIQATQSTDMYLWHDKPVLSVEKLTSDSKTHVVVTALVDLYLQEPGVVVNVIGPGKWRPFGPHGKWTADRWFEVKQDAHVGTIHFSRNPQSPTYTVGVEYRDGKERLRFRSDGGFANLLKTPPPSGKPYLGCDVFGRGWKVKGTVHDPTGRSLLRWELARLPSGIMGMYFLGWPGGAGTVVQGVYPYYADQIPHPSDAKTGRDPSAPIDHVWDFPRSWRMLHKGQAIVQNLRLAA